MRLQIFGAMLLIALSFSACKKDTIKLDLVDTNGNDLTMSFNTTKDIVIIQFHGETATLKKQKLKSGLWYMGDDFELLNENDYISLRKFDDLVFEKHNVTINLKKKE